MAQPDISKLLKKKKKRSNHPRWNYRSYLAKLILPSFLFLVNSSITFNHARQLNCPFTSFNRRSINNVLRCARVSSSLVLFGQSRIRREGHVSGGNGSKKRRHGSQRNGTRRIATEKRSVNPFATAWTRFASPCRNTGAECARRRGIQGTRRGSLVLSRVPREDSWNDVGITLE